MELLREEHRLVELRNFIRVCSGYLSLPLFLVFWMADILYAPEYKWLFLVLRLSMIPLFLIIYHSIGKIHTANKAQIIGSAYTLVNSIPISVMMYYKGGAASDYYVGLCLVITGIISFIPWDVRFLVFNVCAILVPYLLLVGLGTDFNQTGAIVKVLVNAFFICGTVVIALVLKNFTEKLRKSEIEHQLKLKDEISRRNAIIEIKTKENIKYVTLSKQFSPQIIHAIQDVDFEDFNTVEKKEICAVFIDIADSTEHMNSVKSENIRTVISNFLDLTSKILLSHSITIDKLMGDGVLGISNAPFAKIDYIDSVIKASFEISEAIERNQDKFLPYWNGKLKIHIGIAAGPAEVGFFGKDEFYKTYTAIGPVVNMASRICGSCGPDKMIITRQVMDKISQDGYQIKYLGEHPLKGFPDTPLYEISQEKMSAYDDDSTIPCPQCRMGIIEEVGDLQGMVTLCCNNCKYEPKSFKEIRKIRVVS